MLKCCPYVGLPLQCNPKQYTAMTANLSATASAQASLSAISSASTLVPAATFTVDANDVIFITVSELGREILTLTLRGSSSVCQLMEQLRRHLEGIEGRSDTEFPQRHPRHVGETRAASAPFRRHYSKVADEGEGSMTDIRGRRPTQYIYRRCRGRAARGVRSDRNAHTSFLTCF